MIYTFIIYYYIQNKYNYILPKTIWNIFKFIMSFSRYTKIYNEYNEQYTSASQLCITNSQKERKRKKAREKERKRKKILCDPFAASRNPYNLTDI